MHKQKLLLGVTGAIGAINLPQFLYELNNHYDINIVLTKGALKFVTIEGLQPLVTGVYTDLHDMSRIKVPHVNLLDSLDKFLILPASANFLAKIANGYADDLLSLCVLNYGDSIYIAPNMNSKMWGQRSVQANVTRIKEYGHIFINVTADGLEASSGESKLSEAALPQPDQLFDILNKEERELNHI